MLQWHCKLDFIQKSLHPYRGCFRIVIMREELYQKNDKVKGCFMEGFQHINEVTSNLYDSIPKKSLFHYTSISNLLSIIEHKSLWASEIKYFSDEGEIFYTEKLFQSQISGRLDKTSHESKRRMLTQLQKWLFNRLGNGHLLFVLSFTENGNQLSQWRSYCSNAKGVSIGFDPEKLKKIAQEQLFQLGRCIYDHSKQIELINNMLDYIEHLSNKKGENTNRSKRHPMNSFNDIFEEVEENILRIAALIKHPAFVEEEEWRLVSKIICSYVTPRIKYREGVSFLVPYLEVTLPKSEDREIEIEKIYLGPTPNQNIAMQSLNMFLSKSEASPKGGIVYSCIPYRTW